MGLYMYRSAGAGPRDTGRNLLGIRTGRSLRVASVCWGSPHCERVLAHAHAGGMPFVAFAIQNSLGKTLS